MSRPTYEQIGQLLRLQGELGIMTTIPDNQEHAASYIESLEKLKRITTKIQAEYKK
jgi:hypothetical protein